MIFQSDHLKSLVMMLKVLFIRSFSTKSNQCRSSVKKNEVNDNTFTRRRKTEILQNPKEATELGEKLQVTTSGRSF